MTLLTLLAASLVALVLGRLVVAVVRFVRLTPAGRRHWLPARWHRARWHRLARNLGLAYQDKHLGGLDSRRKPRVVYPRARFRPDEFGLSVRIKTIPRVGRAEFELAAPYLEDAWRCVRVSVAQPKPGRLLVRGLRRDPLTEPLSMADVPAEVYGVRKTAAQNSPLGAEITRAFRVYLGRDEWGTDRFALLGNITGAVVGGMPGTGKTTLANSLLCQLAPSAAVRLAIADGQGGADFEPWRDRAYAYAGDDRADAAGLLEDIHAEMRHRFATVLERTGHRNAWRVGPTPDFPLHFLVVDEAHGYLDESMAKGDKTAEAHVRTCRAMLGQLVRRGRSVLMFTLVISQKPTSDAIPSFISANAGLRLCFGVQTADAAVSVLGETIRDHPTLNPITLQGPESVGVLTARLPTGQLPFTRLRVPDVPEDACDVRARELVSS